jgi:hypothetical protein
MGDVEGKVQGLCVMSALWSQEVDPRGLQLGEKFYPVTLIRLAE